MSIKATYIEGEKQFPIVVEFNHVKQRFTKRAAIELRRNLELAISDCLIAEALEGDDAVTCTN